MQVVLKGPQLMACSTSYAPLPVTKAWRASSVAFRPVHPAPRGATMRVAVSPFDIMDRQFEAMDRQFEMMERQMDREFDAAFSRAMAMERQTQAEMTQLRERALAELRSAPNVDIQRQEERGQGTYRYYERIQITSGGGGGAYGRSYTSVPPPASASTAALSPAVGTAGLLGGVVLVGSYLALTVAFARNYALTNYMESKRWLLVMLWPLLFLFSPKFREQFAAAVRGQKAGVKREGNGERL